MFHVFLLSYVFLAVNDITQYKIENMLQFSLAYCIEPFLQCVSFSTFRSSLCSMLVFWFWHRQWLRLWTSRTHFALS